MNGSQTDAMKTGRTSETFFHWKKLDNGRCYEKLKLVNKSFNNLISFYHLATILKLINLGVSLLGNK